MGRRQDSLIPLSRGHHYALVLCLQIHKGLPPHVTDGVWLQSKAEAVIEFFDCDLATHFRAEEEVLFPAMSAVSEAKELIDDLLEEHRHLEDLVAHLRTADENSIGVSLLEFAGTLEAHVRKEERELFPIYEKLVSATVASEIERGIIERVGMALEPSHPERFR